MKAFLKKLMGVMLSAAILVTGIPAQALAAGTPQTESPDKLELSDDYIRVTVSGENGGFLIDTLEGNKLKKSDDNKFLLYPAGEYDTSYTSFRITRTDGGQEDYIFGRDYGFLGLDSSDVSLSRQGNTLTAVWSVKDLTIEQRLSLSDESAAQHGMVSIEYSVTTQRDDVADMQVRIMLDTALGYQDYAVYELPDAAGDYAHIRKETLLDNQDGTAFSGILFAADDPGAPKVTAYTVNTTIGGQTVTPYQAGFGHWNNLASTVFDFYPDGSLDFTNPYNEEYMTADSAYALYYDLGALTGGKTVTMSTYYGVFSNATVSAEEQVAINFAAFPGTMTLNEAEDAYESQVEGGGAGDISMKLSIENISQNAMQHMTVAVKTQNEVEPYLDWYEKELYREVEGEGADYTYVFDDFQAGEEEQLEVFFQVSPLPASEYRRFEVLCYNAARGEALTDEKLLGSREFYLFCPGVLGETVAFTSIEPQMVYTQGSRNLYLTGQNMALLRDTTAYVTYLHSLSGGEDVIVPAKNVVVDPEKNSMYLVVDSALDAGGYQVVFDWNEAGKEDATSPMLQFQASDKPEYLSPIYGIVTIEKEKGYTSDNPRYRLMAYSDEEQYAKDMKDPNNRVLLEFRGNFSLWYDEAGNVTEAKAVSLEDVEGKITDTITISNCLDVEAGSVSIVVENPGTDDQAISTAIDGRVYTTNSRTKVWTGVCAISTIENGEESTLLQYTSDGEPTDDLENSVANTNAITLVWPGAASTAQTLAGIVLEFRYCQFGMMALEDGTVTDTTPKRRVIAFGAQMSPDFLIPSNFNWSERETSAMEVAQLKLAKSNYTAQQLLSVQERYANDQAAWEAAEGGSLALYVHDILFGGGFIGFNCSVEVGLPSYAEGLPSIEGTLSLKIMPMDKWWEVGVAGSADFGPLAMEASLRLKSYNGIPVPDNLYFYAGGFTPGINVDGMGIFWIQGLGGGFDKLYDTLFVSSAVPPLTLMLSGQFALFTILQARADLKLSLRGFDVRLSNIGLNGINLIDSIGVSDYWYPKISLNASLDVNILNIIQGGGYIVLQEKKNGGIFWEGFVTASVKTPRIPLIGSITVGSAELGVNASKIWGALHILMLDMGVTYYWGGDVDFSFGKYDAPEPTLPVMLSMNDIPVYTDEETGRVLYMCVGTNASLEAESQSTPLNLDRDEAGIESNTDRTSHTISLGQYTGNSDMALSVLYTADSLAEARQTAYGDRDGRGGLTITDESGNAYPLTWLDTEKPAEEQPSANALLSYDKETKQASVTVSFTQEDSYNHIWTLKSQKPADLALYALRRLPGIDKAEYVYAPGGSNGTASLAVEWSGSQVQDIEHLAVYAISGDDEPYVMYQTDSADQVAAGTLRFDVPDTLPSGTYTLRLAAVSEANSVNDMADIADKNGGGTGFTYVNPKQPVDPQIQSVRLGGDYSLDVTAAASGGGNADYDGYIATVYELQTENGQDVWTATDFAQQWIERDDMGRLPDTITLGGQYRSAVQVDADENVVLNSGETRAEAVKTEERIFGLEAGKTYCVGLRAYRQTPDGSDVYRSAEVRSDSIVMKAPSPAKLSVRAENAKQLPSPGAPDETIDTVNSGSVTIQITSDQTVSGTWSLDDMTEGTWTAGNQGSITLNGIFEGGPLEEGEHLLKLRGENAGGDGINYQYRFCVDTIAPRLQLSGPWDGAPFGQSVTVAGLSEPGAVIHISGQGRQGLELTVDESGAFEAEVSMDTGRLEQELTVWAEDMAGNRSREYALKLTNELLGAEDARIAIYLDGENCTGKTIPGDRSGNLELRIVSEKAGKNVVIPEDSNIGRQAEWSLEIMEGTASLDGQRLTMDSQVNGVLLVALDQQSAGTVLGGSQDLSGMTYGITLPEDPIGYTIHTDQELTVKYGEDFAFTVEIAQGYSRTENFAVLANGNVLTEENGKYVIKGIYEPKTVTVTGVADITPPELTISVGDNGWKKFLNTITFGTFFKETQSVIIAASDHGSGIDKTEYYISDRALGLDEVKGLGDKAWSLYTKGFSIDPDGKYIIYAKSADHAGNVTYVSSDGIIVEKEPVGTWNPPGNGGDTTDKKAETNQNAYTKPASGNKNTGSKPGSQPEGKEPFIKNDPGMQGWKRIGEAVGKAEDGNNIMIDMNSTAVVPGSVLESIRGKDVTIVFDMGNGITWSVNGKTVKKGEIDDIDFSVQRGTKTIPEDAVRKAAGEYYSFQLSLAHKGEYGFSPVLSMNLGKENAGLTASLYLYKEADGELEAAGTAVIAGDGTVEFTFTYGADCVIVVETEDSVEEEDSIETEDSMEAGSGNEASDTPKEPAEADVGDSGSRSGWLWWIVVIGAAALIAGAGILFIIMKRKKEEKEE